MTDARGRGASRQPPQPSRKLDISQDNLRTIREGARLVVTSGHAPMSNAKLPIAGKTGTAEFGAANGRDSAGHNKLGFHNWFVSFLPQADNTDPTAQIAMAI